MSFGWIGLLKFQVGSYIPTIFLVPWQTFDCFYFSVREVEGLFLDLIGDDVETIQPELMAPKNLSPKKKRTAKRRSSERNGGRKSADDKVSMSLIGGLLGFCRCHC